LFLKLLRWFQNACAFAWHQPADVPYAITVVGSEYYNTRPGEKTIRTLLFLLPPAMQVKGLRRNDDYYSTKSWYLKKTKNQDSKNVFIGRTMLWKQLLVLEKNNDRTSK
jgi:hypothetical protein